jgi:hypothetical protein
MLWGVLGLVDVKPGLQLMLSVFPEAGWHPACHGVLGLLELPPQAHASATEIAKDFFIVKFSESKRRARRREGLARQIASLTLRLGQESGGDAFGASR